MKDTRQEEAKMWTIEQPIKNTWQAPYDVVDHEQGAMVSTWTYEQAVSLCAEQNERDYPRNETAWRTHEQLSNGQL